MVLAAAIIGGGAALAGGGLAASGSKKGNEGQKMLAQLAQQLFTQTGPERKVALEQSMQALETGTTDNPVIQAIRSAIGGQGAKQKQAASAELTRQGLRNSSAGVANLEDIDRMISQLISQANISDVTNLANFGRSIGFGQVPGQAISAAGTLAQVQAGQQAALTSGAAGAGTSAGQALALLLSRSTTEQTPYTSSSGSYGRTGAVPENIPT